MADAPPTQAERAERFHALHQGAEPFLLANAFDAGSARILAGLEFEALGTTSGVVAAATEARDKGTFSYVDQVMSSADVAGYMRR